MSDSYLTRDYDEAAWLSAVENRQPVPELDRTGDVHYRFKVDETLLYDIEQFRSKNFAYKLLQARRRIVKMGYQLRHGQEVENR